MLYRGITRKYKRDNRISFWTSSKLHAVKYCFEQEGAQLLELDEAGLNIIDCPEEIGDSWLNDEKSQNWAKGFLKGKKVDGFRRFDELGDAIGLLPTNRVRISEQF